MEYQLLLDCLAADLTRLRQAAALDLTAPVPNCPGWTVDDLVRHVAEVYLNKAEAMRLGAFPRPWPPGLTGEPALALLDRAAARLTEEFGAHDPRDAAVTWYEPEQTVGFWIRRMAQETVIHRVDAEQAAGLPIADIPGELAVDGVDEVLERFLAYGSVHWADELTGVLPTEPLPSVLVATDGYGWLVRAAPDGVHIQIATPSVSPGATVTGDPVPLLLWLWGRETGGVEIVGDRSLVGRLRELLRATTQ